MKRSALLLLVTGFTHAQTSAKPQFEVVSVKQNAGAPGLVGIHFDPGGRFTATNIPLPLLIDMAYGVGTNQEHRSVPGWVSSESTRYNISAKAEGDPSRDEMFAMVRTMLEDRFKLQSHREKKEVTIYALTVAKGGPKIKEAEKSGCIDAAPGDVAPSSTVAPVCGYFAILRGRLEAMRVNMAKLSGVLSTISEIGRPVVDKTGITTTFDVHLRWTPPGPGPEVDNGGPSLFTALEEQFGLKLEPQKGTDDVFVIDHIERPTEN